MQIRWAATEGLKAGQIVEVDDTVGQAYIAAGRATPIELMGAVADVQETPEQPKRRTGDTAPTAVAPQPETR